MDKKHVLLTGPRGSGKSSLIRTAVSRLRAPVCGFVTDFLPADENGFHPIYIHPAGQENRLYRDENCIGTCDTRIHNIRPEVFDTVGTGLIRAAKPGGLLVMDELGFMEEKSPPFMDAVLEALDGSIPVLAACKNRTDIPFLSKVRMHPSVILHDLGMEPWDHALNDICGWLRAMEMLR